jgi:hypothetical protein
MCEVLASAPTGPKPTTTNITLQNQKTQIYHANKEISQQCLYAAITRVTVESISTSNDVKIL